MFYFRHTINNLPNLDVVYPVHLVSFEAERMVLVLKMRRPKSKKRY